jgi:ABC-type phosphate transport system ATPase subunit
VRLDDTDIYADDVDPVLVRRWVGMVFQKPNPFPSMSIKDNVVAGLRLTHRYDRKDAPGVIERALRQAALWDEVKDKLNEPGTSLSGGQQQRLCIARALAVNPDVILLDEPCSALDPIATARIEELLLEIRRDYTMVIVTHNMGQAQRVAEHTAFFLQGELVEFDTTAALFGQPARSPHRRLHRRPVRVRSRAARRPVRDRRAGCRQGRRAAANPSTISPMRHLRAGLAVCLLAFPALASAQPTDEDETGGGTVHESDEVIGPDGTEPAPPDDTPPPDDATPAAPIAHGGNTGYDKGFFIKSDDGKFSLKIKSRVQPYLAMTRSKTPAADWTGAFEVRRARLILEGNLHGDDLRYKIQSDFGKGNPRSRTGTPTPGCRAARGSAPASGSGRSRASRSPRAASSSWPTARSPTRASAPAATSASPCTTATRTRRRSSGSSASGTAPATPPASTSTSPTRPIRWSR